MGENASALHFWLHTIWHPLTGNGYQFWSGIGSDFQEATLLGLILTAMIGAWRTYHKHYECHETGCSKHGKYVIEGGVRCCDEHHPALDVRPRSERGLVHSLHRAHLDLLREHRSAQ